MESQQKRDINLDSILAELGALGRYQMLQFTLLSVIVLLTSSASFSYIFSSGKLDYRCKIPTCDRSTNESTVYAPDWLHFAVPFRDDGKPAYCQKFQTDPTAQVALNVKTIESRCEKLMFNQSVIEKCDDFVFASDELTIVNEFNITCEDKEWQLALVGSLGYVAELIVLPIIAFVSDKYGRRPVLIATLMLGGICGIIKSLSVNYIMFATMEFVTAFVSGGSYMTLFIMAIESVGPSYRVFSGTLISLMYSTSQAVTGLVAMYVPNFRTLLMILYGPNVLMLPIVWLVPESVRWLVTNGKIAIARPIIIKAANMNKIKLCEDSLHALDSPSNQKATTQLLPVDTKSAPNTFATVLQSRVLAIRLAVNICIWFMIKLVYFGMTIQSMSLVGNKYVNFIVVSAVELPATLMSSLLMERMGRKWSLFAALLLTGTACVATDFVSADAWLASLLVYITGKCCVTIAFSVLYVYSSEQFPTSVRHSTMNACYSIGTVGSILAPFTMLLVSAWPSLPLLIFGVSALSSGMLVLLLPETLNTRLPDTVEEAEQLDTFNKSPTKGISL